MVLYAAAEVQVTPLQKASQEAIRTLNVLYATLSAVRKGAPYYCDDVFADPATMPWRAFATAFEANTVAAIPIRLRAAPPGVVNLYSRQKGLYKPEVRSLVAEMGDDITYAIEGLEMALHRNRAEEALIERQAELNCARAVEATVGAMAATVETRDPYTAATSGA